MKRVILVIGLAGLFLAKAGEGYAADIEAVLDDNAGASEFVVQDSDNVQVLGVSSDGDITLTDTTATEDPWIGLGESAGRIEFDDQTTDEINFLDANVGIGTTSPANKLDVEGGVAVGAAYSGAETAPSNGMIIEGNVGIGTTGPSGKLSIYKGSNDDILRLASPSGVGNYSGIRFEGTVGGWGLAAIRAIDVGSYNGDLVFYTDGDNTNNVNLQERVRILSNGNVGIGTTSPDYKLEVAGAVMMEDSTAPTASTGHSGIYSSSGELYALDSAGNSTLLSPHDKDTGEWVFYSKNTRTGRVVRVNMEKLVKAVEQLTGEQFMVETYEEPGALQ